MMVVVDKFQSQPCLTIQHTVSDWKGRADVNVLNQCEYSQSGWKTGYSAKPNLYSLIRRKYAVANI